MGLRLHLLSTIKSLDSKFGLNHWFPCLKPFSVRVGTIGVHVLNISGFLVNTEKFAYFCIRKILKILFHLISLEHLWFRERVNGFNKCTVFSSISCSCHPIHIEFWGFPEEFDIRIFLLSIPTITTHIWQCHLFANCWIWSCFHCNEIYKYVVVS